MRNEAQPKSSDRPIPDSAFRIPHSALGPLVVVSGPSGVGKTTVVDRVLAGFDRPVRRVVTATTRAPRPGEVDGRDYYFWPPAAFERAIADGRMLEHALVHGTDYYGTPRAEVDPYRAKGVGVVAVIDVQGAAAVRRLYPGDHLSVFLLPPTFDDLAARLRGRGEPPAGIEKRLQTARVEVTRVNEFDRVVVNADVAAAARVLGVLIRRSFREADSCTTT
jgi:guanylate kinase